MDKLSDRRHAVRMSARTGPIDVLDARLIALLTAQPRIGVLECARRLHVARGTVQARLDRLAERGVIPGDRPEIAPVPLRHGGTAVRTLEIPPSPGPDPPAAHPAPTPPVLRVPTTPRPHDLPFRHLP